MTMTTSLLSPLEEQLLAPIKTVNVESGLPATRDNILLVGTHGGSFHCDEALAIGMLHFLPNKKKIHIIRTRNPQLLEPCEIVVDVGAVYEPERHRYDHHQREFQGVLEPYQTRLSSAGLVYKHFGQEIIKNIIAHFAPGEAQRDEWLQSELPAACYSKVYENFIQHIDAIDNGIAVASSPLNYRVSTTLSARVGNLNPAWNEPQTPELTNERFKHAVLLTATEFLQSLTSVINIWWPARSIVQRAVENRLRFDPEGRIIVLEQFCPWKDHLFDIEIEKGIPQTIYALYADSGGGWRIQAVPKDPSSFESRKTLPAAWWGLREGILSATTGIEGCIFIHANGFIGGHNTFEGALTLAKKALEI